jgi:hypothetical protein
VYQAAICHSAHISVNTNVHFTFSVPKTYLPHCKAFHACCGLLCNHFIKLHCCGFQLLTSLTSQLSGPATLLPPVHNYTHLNFLYLSCHHNIVPCCFIFSLTLSFADTFLFLENFFILHHCGCTSPIGR